MFGILTILVIILTVIIATEKPTKHVKKIQQIILSKPTPAHSPTPAPTYTPTPSPQPTVVPPTATATSKPNQQSQSVSDFQYPSSTVVSISVNTATFESTDDPKKITDWYKDKIKSIGMKTTSFVQTSTNGNVLNKLVGANGNKEVRVEISKQNNNAVVKIVVVSN